MCFLGLPPPEFQIFRIPGFHPIRGTGEGVRAVSPGRRVVGQADFFMAEVIF